ncbi:hypothetical protein [Klebsiella pneumoniae IS10]|nr:hypothetical protein [Klebsiella pneumoniae IS10]
MSITIETPEKNGDVHKPADVQRQPKTKLLLRHRSNIFHASKPGKRRIKHRLTLWHESVG